ncbi:MAG TPA: UbiA family prenyltransferase, partial [Bacteroidales bacterium]|nr:UbiA family prenyltransferase [Bacteroidales bacterium]
MLRSNGFDLQMSNFDFFLLVLATVCLTAGGYIINDYFDRKADLVNRPGAVIVGLLIKSRWTMVFHIVFNSIGILSGLYLAFKIHAIYLGILFILGSGILWFYSTTYKKQLIIGNLIVSFSTGMVPVLVLLFELPLLSARYGSIIDAMGINANQLAGWILGFAIFGFLISLIREIV